MHKLQRFPKMKLSRMQDIGGARVVLATIRDVDELKKLYMRTRARHKLANEKDYVLRERETGGLLDSRGASAQGRNQECGCCGHRHRTVREAGLCADDHHRLEYRRVVAVAADAAWRPG